MANKPLSISKAKKHKGIQFSEDSLNTAESTQGLLNEPSFRDRVAFRSVEDEEQFLSCLLYAYCPEDAALYDNGTVSISPC